MTNATKNLGKYKKQNLFGGWTRIEMLLQLYDRAISSISATKTALEADDQQSYAKFFVDSQKTILAIHTGLKPDEHDVAYNIARLLHFVLRCLEEKNFEQAILVMTELRAGFGAIAAEANELEQQGEISPMETNDVYQTMA